MFIEIGSAVNVKDFANNFTNYQSINLYYIDNYGLVYNTLLKDLTEKLKSVQKQQTDIHKYEKKPTKTAELGSLTDLIVSFSAPFNLRCTFLTKRYGVLCQ